MYALEDFANMPDDTLQKEWGCSEGDIAALRAQLIRAVKLPVDFQTKVEEAIERVKKITPKILENMVDREFFAARKLLTGPLGVQYEMERTDPNAPLESDYGLE